MKTDTLNAPPTPYEVTVPLVREPVVRQLAGRDRWVACLLPALVLVGVAVTR